MSFGNSRPSNRMASDNPKSPESDNNTSWRAVGGPSQSRSASNSPKNKQKLAVPSSEEQEANEALQISALNQASVTSPTFQAAQRKNSSSNSLWSRGNLPSNSLGSPENRASNSWQPQKEDFTSGPPPGLSKNLDANLGGTIGDGYFASRNFPVGGPNSSPSKINNRSEDLENIFGISSASQYSIPISGSTSRLLPNSFAPDSHQDSGPIPIMRPRSKSISFEPSQLSSGQNAFTPAIFARPDDDMNNVDTSDDGAAIYWRRGSATNNPLSNSFNISSINSEAAPHRRSSTFSNSPWEKSEIASHNRDSDNKKPQYSNPPSRRQSNSNLEADKKIQGPLHVSSSQQTQLSPIRHTYGSASMLGQGDFSDFNHQSTEDHLMSNNFPRRYTINPSMAHGVHNGYYNRQDYKPHNARAMQGYPREDYEENENRLQNHSQYNLIQGGRRHSIAGPSSIAYRVPGRNLTEAFGSLRLEEFGYVANTDRYRIARFENNEGQLRSEDNFVGGQSRMKARPFASGMQTISDANDDEMSGKPVRNDGLSEVGRGVPLHALPSTTKMFIVEFKAGRSDIFYVAEDTGLEVKSGALVIVEGDRGKDLGKVTSEITLHQVHMLQAQQSEALSDLHRVNREIHPKRIFRYASADEVMHMVTKSQDEAKALSVCQTKVRQKKLDMEVVDAEYQWDRRKLTFYFVANRRIDFRELVHDLFKIYKTRIWMNAVPTRIELPNIDEFDETTMKMRNNETSLPVSEEKTSSISVGSKDY